MQTATFTSANHYPRLLGLLFPEAAKATKNIFNVSTKTVVGI